MCLKSLLALYSNIFYIFYINVRYEPPISEEYVDFIIIFLSTAPPNNKLWKKAQSMQHIVVQSQLINTMVGGVVGGRKKTSKQPIFHMCYTF